MKNRKNGIVNGLFYSLGGVGLQLCWYMINNYLTIYYTDVIGLSAASISFIMIVSRVWDAINDPMMGSLGDATKSRWGKFRPYLMFVPPFMALFQVLIFTAFPGTNTVKTIICLITYNCAAMAGTALSISLNSIVNVTTGDPDERMRMVSFRSSGAAIVDIVLSAIGMPLILLISHSDKATAKGYTGATIIFSLIMVVCFELCAWKTKEDSSLYGTKKDGQKPSLIHSLKVVFTNKYLVMIILTTIFGSMSSIGRVSTLSYYVIYVMGSYNMIAPMLTIMSVCCLVGTILMPTLSKLVGKRNLLITYNVLAIICYVTIYFTPVSNTALILGLTAIIGVCNSQQYLLFGIVSDCIDYGELHNGTTDVGIAMSMLGFASKLASAVAGSVTVIMLSAVGYVAGAQQTPAVQQGINAVVNLMPAGCLVIGLIPLLMYKLTEKKMVTVRAELAKLRESQAQEQKA